MEKVSGTIYSARPVGKPDFKLNLGKRSNRAGIPYSLCNCKWEIGPTSKMLWLLDSFAK
jgi:hypothetical protein